MSFKTWMLAHIPPPLADSLMRTKRRILPTREFRRMREIHAALGRPQEILAGPFKGIRYIDAAGHLPKVLGSFENELNAAVEQLCALAPDVILNIGSAEGFYAVGLARRLAQTKVIAYDIAALPRYRLAKLARLNNLDGRIDIRGLCDLPELQREVSRASRPAVVIDCEGCEGDLLDPQKAPALSKAIVLVETHDLYRPGVTQSLLARFSPTHS